MLSELPPAVAFKNAQGIGRSDIRERLTSDPRMARVWNELLRQTHVAANRLEDDDYSSISYSDRFQIKSNCSLQDTACGVFFAHACAIMTVDAALWASSEWKNVERQWQWMLLTLEDEARWCQGEKRNHLLSTAVYLKERMETHEHAVNGHLYEREGFKASNQVRDKLVRLAHKTKRLYGRYLVGTLTTVINVGLEQNINRDDAENWLRAATPVIEGPP